jgi:DNA processing protein
VCHTYLTALPRVANCFPLVTTVQLTLDRLPSRLAKRGWDRPVFVRGQVSEGPAVAIIGARAATRVFMDRAHALARHLAERGHHVVSGGALGIDGAAHRGALAGGGTTTVVCGTGLDIAYPQRHAALFAEVVARGGALLGLLPDGTGPRKGTFVQRNPIIAALADVVIVVEADVRSGSLSTAAAGRAMGRVIAAWPGSRGCDSLLAQGAAIVECVDDVDAILAGTPRKPAVRELDPIAERVRRAIIDGARGVDEVVEVTQLPVREVMRALGAMRGIS